MEITKKILEKYKNIALIGASKDLFQLILNYILHQVNEKIYFQLVLHL